MWKDEKLKVKICVFLDVRPRDGVRSGSSAGGWSSSAGRSSDSLRFRVRALPWAVTTVAYRCCRSALKPKASRCSEHSRGRAWRDTERNSDSCGLGWRNILQTIIRSICFDLIWIFHYNLSHMIRLEGKPHHSLKYMYLCIVQCRTFTWSIFSTFTEIKDVNTSWNTVLSSAAIKSIQIHRKQ